MAIPNSTVVKLAKKGIKVASDLVKFDNTTIKLIADNLKRLGRQVTGPNEPTTTIATPEQSEPSAMYKMGPIALSGRHPFVSARLNNSGPAWQMALSGRHPFGLTMALSGRHPSVLEWL